MRLCVAVAVVCLSIIGLASANDVRASIRKPTNIPAHSLGAALQALAKDRNFQVVYVSEEVNSLRTHGAVGEFTSEEALKQLLSGTGMTFRYLDENTVTIVRLSTLSTPAGGAPAPPDTTSGGSTPGDSQKEGKKSSSDTFRLAQRAPGQNSSTAAVEREDENAEEAAEKKPRTLEEVIVTAQKRSEKLLDVPASISVLTSDDLASLRIESTDDITRAVPGFSFSPQSGNGSTVGVGSENLVIRGIGSAVGSATVGVYLDEVPLTQLIQAGTFVPRVFDLDRLEVLRGPQGTLYGASSEGGTVRFITKQPNLDKGELVVGGTLSHTQGADFNTDGKAVVNVPLIHDVLAVRAGVEFTQNSGWIDRYAHAPGDLTTPTSTLLAKDVNAERDLVLRVAAKYQPEATLSITPSIMYQTEHQDDSPAYFLGAGLYQQWKTVAEPADDSGTLSSLTVEKRLSFADLTSITSYFSRTFDRSRDGTFFDSNYVVPAFLDTDPRTAAQAPIANLTLAVLPVIAQDNEHATAFNQEVRLASSAGENGSRPLTWVVGAYFSDNVDTLVHDELAPGWNALFQQLYGFSVNDPVQSPLANPADPSTWQDNFFHFVSRNEYRQMAVFGQIDYEILPKLRASAGLRYQVADLDFSWNGKGYYAIGIDNVNLVPAKDVALTPKASLSYKPTPTVNVYATAAKGYRDAGFNVPVPQAVCGPDEKQIGLSGAPPSSYGPDHLWSYELGIKASLADNHLSINADVYDIRWNQIQQQIVIPVCAFDFTSNVGAAEAYGSELEVQYRPPFVSGLAFGLSGTTEHATITSTNANSVATVGDKLLFTPDWTATLSATYTKPIGHGLSLVVRADNYWQGRSYGEFTPGTPDYINREYSVLNASLGVLSDDGLEVQLFAKNLLDNTTVIREPTIAAVTQAYTLPPRIVGIEAKKRF